MTYEQKIIYNTLCEVRDEIYTVVDTLKSTIKNDNSIGDKVQLAQADTLEVAQLLVAKVAQKHGIKVGFVETE